MSEKSADKDLEASREINKVVKIDGHRRGENQVEKIYRFRGTKSLV